MKDSMTCEVFEGLLPRYLEGETTAGERIALEAHAAGCAQCGAMLDGIREITREASALSALVPSRDLWEGIAARIEAPALPLDSRRGHVVSVSDARPRSWRSARLAAAAAVLIVSTAGITHLVTRQMMTGEGNEVAMMDVAPEPNTFVPDDTTAGVDDVPATSPATPAPVAAPRTATTPKATAPRQAPAPISAGAGTLVASSARAEAVYDREIAALQDMLDRRRAELDPATTIVLENNLRIIDRAIRDSRSALARDPASGFLTEQLTTALDKKLQLMRTAAKLPSRT